MKPKPCGEAGPSARSTVRSARNSTSVRSWSYQYSNKTLTCRSIVFSRTRQRDKRSHQRLGPITPGAAHQTIESDAESEIDPTAGRAKVEVLRIKLPSLVAFREVLLEDDLF